MIRVTRAGLVIGPLLVLSLGLAGASKIGYPCTQYKPADIARAKANIASFDWARKIHDGLKESAAYYLGMDRKKIRSLISDQTPLAAIKCPVCGKAPWSWYNLLDGGNILECADCKTRWKWDPSDRSETWNIPAVFRYYRLEYVTRGLTAAALLYQLDGDKVMAEKAAIVVERFAEAFKGYRVNMVHKNQWLDHPDPYYAKIAGWKLREMAIVRNVLLAYDLIHDSGALAPAQIGKIDKDLVAYTRDYLLAGYGPGGPASPDSLQDQGPSWWVLAACGALLGDDATLDVMVSAFEKVLDPGNGLLYEDGTFFEGSPGYENQLLDYLLPVPQVLAGNSPRGVYGNPRCALLEKCCAWSLDFLYPDGTVPSINDAHVKDVPSRRQAEVAAQVYGNRKARQYLIDVPGRAAEEESGQVRPATMEQRGYEALFTDASQAAGGGAPYADASLHLTGSGLMVLREGRDAATRIMAFLDYGAYEPPNKPPYHKHQDYLNIGLWADGREMLSEMGYAHTPPWVQKWQVSPPAHNTVLEAAEQKEGGRALLWQITPGPKLAEAGLPPANSRFLALLPRAGGEPLVVDIFRVNAYASSFTWAVHAKSSALEVRGAAALRPAEVEAPLRNGRLASLPSGTVEAVWRFPGATAAGLKMLVAGEGKGSLVVSECPPEEDEINAAHMKGGTLKPGAVLPYRGHIQVTKPGPEADFIAVYAPFAGDNEPRLELAVRNLPDGAVALHIAAGEERFVVIHSPKIARLEDEGLALDGRVGVACWRGERLVSLTLGEGRALKLADAGIFRSTIGNGYETLPKAY